MFLFGTYDPTKIKQLQYLNYEIKMKRMRSVIAKLRKPKSSLVKKFQTIAIYFFRSKLVHVSRH